MARERRRLCSWPTRRLCGEEATDFVWTTYGETVEVRKVCTEHVRAALAVLYRRGRPPKELAGR